MALFAVEEYSEGIATAQRALREIGELQWFPLKTHTLFGLGLLACGSGDFARGITLLTAAVRQYREDGIILEALMRSVLERCESSARAALGEDGYDAAVSAGSALSRDQAIERVGFCLLGGVVRCRRSWRGVSVFA